MGGAEARRRARSRITAVAIGVAYVALTAGYGLAWARAPPQTVGATLLAGALLGHIVAAPLVGLGLLRSAS